MKEFCIEIKHQIAGDTMEIHALRILALLPTVTKIEDP